MVVDESTRVAVAAMDSSKLESLQFEVRALQAACNKLRREKEEALEAYTEAMEEVRCLVIPPVARCCTSVHIFVVPVRLQLTGDNVIPVIWRCMKSFVIYYCIYRARLLGTHCLILSSPTLVLLASYGVDSEG